MKLAWLAATLVLSMQTASAVQAQQSAEELLWGCTKLGPYSDDVKYFNQIMCISYISGAHDMLRMLSDGFKANLICTPKDGLSNDQLVRVVVKWIEKNPERMHESARMAILSAIGEAFPCTKPSPPKATK